MAWLRDPRYAGTVSGRFRVEGAGSGAATLLLTAAGRISSAELFSGVLSDADVSLEIEQGTLKGGFNGRLAGVDPAIPFSDPRLAASLTGSADVRTTVRDLLTRTPSLADYEVTGRMTLGPSTIRGLRVDDAAIDGTLADERLTVARLDVSGPALDATASGSVALNGRDSSDFQYEVTRADLAALRPITGGSAEGLAITKGRLTGPTTALRAVGDATLSSLNAFGIKALTMTGDYDATIPSGPDNPRPTARVTTRATFVELFGQAMEEASGTITLADDRADFSLAMSQGGRKGDLAGAVLLHLDRQSIDLLALDVTIGSMPWRLVGSEAAPTVAWSDAGITISSMTFATGHEDDQRIDLAGTWRYDGSGALRVTARNTFLEMFQGTPGGRPARYGGMVDLDATIRGTRNAPMVTGTITISNGRVERVTYEKLVGQVDFSQGAFTIDVRLDQAPGIWMTAKGTVPLALFDRDLPDRPIDVAIVSSDIDLALLAGVTDVVNAADRPDAPRRARDRHGPRSPLRGIGRDRGRRVHREGDRCPVPERPRRHTNRLGSHHRRVVAPRGRGRAGPRGARQSRHARATRRRSRDRSDGRPVPRSSQRVRPARHQRDVEHPGRVRGAAGWPGTSRSTATVCRSIGSSNAPCSNPTRRRRSPSPRSMPSPRLNPWDRMGLDISLHIPRTLRLIGSDVQVSPGTPIGLGDIDLRVGGDLYLFKDPADMLYVTGSLDQISGTYVFQGRRFEIDEAGSSINFVGDLNPQLWVAVGREISGVQTRVTVSGSLRQPELQLASTPPLEESDILSLIVFNTTPNDLTALQQQELAVRAGTLAAGFLAQPLIQALQTELGLEAFEIETGGDAGSGANAHHRRGARAGPRRQVQPAVRAGFLEPGDPRVLPVAPVPGSRDLFRCPVDHRPLCLPAGRARRHRPAAFFSASEGDTIAEPSSWIRLQADQSG